MPAPSRSTRRPALRACVFTIPTRRRQRPTRQVPPTSSTTTFGSIGEGCRRARQVELPLDRARAHRRGYVRRASFRRATCRCRIPTTWPEACGRRLRSRAPSGCAEPTTTTTSTSTSVSTTTLPPGTTTTTLPSCVGGAPNGIREAGEQCDGGPICFSNCTLSTTGPGCCRHSSVVPGTCQGTTCVRE